MAKVAFQGAASDVAESIYDPNARVNALNDLAQSIKARLKTGAALNDSDFAELVARTLAVLEFDEDTLARTIKVSRPTIGRWTRGESAPLPLARRSVYEEMHKCIRERIKLLRSHEKKGFFLSPDAA